MKKRKMMVTLALVLGLVLLVGFHVLAASGAPHKQGKHLVAKTLQETAYKPDKHLANKTPVSPQGMALVGWGMMSTGIVGALLAPWTRQQFDDIENMLRTPWPRHHVSE